MNVESPGAEFGVERVRTDDDMRTRVAGRCYRGLIRLGDVFTSAYRYDVHRVGHEYTGPSERYDVHSVHLVVESMTAYGREFTEIDEGFVAELSLEGPDSSHVVPGLVLATNC
jgi:hypothetical protein